MKVAVLDDWQRIAAQCTDWSALAARAEITFFHDSLKDEAQLAERLAPFDILLTLRERTRFPASLTARLPRLRLLNVTGMRNLSVDVAALEARGVVVCRTESGEGGESTSELALCLMLTAARRVAAGDASVRAGTFQSGIAPGISLKGRTLGLIGLGRLGRMVAGYAAALGMRVIAWSPHLTAERAAEAGVAYASKEELLRTADVVSLHLVLAPQTRGIIGAAELALMKPGAILVNTSRSPLVDTPALIARLNEGTLLAGLDVYDEEPLPAGHPLLSAPNVVLSPHLGYCVEENFEVFYRQSVENALAFLDGAPVRLMPASAGMPVAA
ncbi:D-2-hydroxyacid dehydrogenase family protein [Ancylobacter sp. MQZ15Z-1]|uniref:D-2-hydroxyacid dehydrogenase family protein n=1 Tax=Ancylobacter mangrovi TaxID=2972472 RepID=A0A9X2PFE5_9HYPH|nr:D-2-hydroxyacid dehydrogenase family protein [Ancylobacter mangrovi]MCS0494477.1 D-2-hydroxyacid dehydrogenase family protein [Ancylobacter mangrovi]